MKLDRLIAILVTLLRKRKVQAKELAEMFDVSVRTILRDVEALNLAGIPIVTYQGANGGIGIAEGFRIDKSLLTSEELATIMTALRSVATSVPDIKHDILMDKFVNTLSDYERNLLNLKTKQLVIDLAPWGGNEFLKEMLAVLKRAIAKGQEITFAYIDSKGLKSDRRAEPYTLVLKRNSWYLYAWCIMRQDFRFFKLGRIKDLQVCEKTFQPREIDLEEFPWDKNWLEEKNIVELELAFDKAMEEAIINCFGRDYLEKDDKFLVKTVMPENDWLYGFILSFGPTVEVLNPPQIRQAVQKAALEIYNKYISP